MDSRVFSLSVARIVSAAVAAVALTAGAGTSEEAVRFAAVAHPCSYADDTNCFADVNTGGVDGVTFQIFRQGEPLSKILVLEGHMGRVDFGPGKATMGFVPEVISGRGDRARVAFYLVENHLQPSQSETWLDVVPLAAGSRVHLDSVGERLGQPELEIKLIGATLATR